MNICARNALELGSAIMRYEGSPRFSFIQTAQRWAISDGLPFLRDPAGRLIAKPSMIDEYLLDFNRDNYHDKKWKDEGIATSISYENYREKQKKEFDEKFLLAQRPLGSRY